VKTHAALKHPNIISIVDYYRTPNDDKFCIIMEYANGGDLHEKVKA